MQLPPEPDDVVRAHGSRLIEIDIATLGQAAKYANEFEVLRHHLDCGDQFMPHAIALVGFSRGAKQFKCDELPVPAEVMRALIEAHMGHIRKWFVEHGLSLVAEGAGLWRTPS